MKQSPSYYFSKPLLLVIGVNAIFLAFLLIGGGTALGREILLSVDFKYIASGVISVFLATVIVAVISEIRIQRKNFEELYQSEIERHALLRHFEYLVKYANDVIMIMNDHFQIIDINNKGIELYGYTREEFMAMPVISLVPEAEALDFQKGLSELTSVGSWTKELKHRRKDGSVVYVEVSSRLIEVEDQTYIQAIIRDISERKRMELQLEELVEQLAVFNNIAQAFLLTYGDNAFSEVLAAVLVRLGCTDGLIGYLNENHDLTIPAVQFKTMQFYRMKESSTIALRKDWIDTMWGRVLNRQVSILFNQPYPSIGGQLPVHKALAVPIINEKQTLGIIVLANKDTDFEEADKKALEAISQFIAPILAVRFERERTEKELVRAKEKAQESDRLKTVFLQNMSHEIRTPMNAIVGFSELLHMKNDDPEKVKYYSGIINQRSNDLLTLIDDLLFLSRIEAGQTPVQNQNINISSMLNELFTYFRGRIEKDQTKKIRLLMANEAESLVIVTDGVKVRHILVNLIDNAIKYTSKGEVEFGYKMVSNSYITFFVKDTGIGIPPDKQEFVFSRFRQIDEGQHRIGGVGLGLAIVKGLIDLLEGKITIESEQGKGTSLYVSLPCSVIEVKPAKMQSKIVTPDADLLKGRFVLIVEDDRLSSEFLQELLTPLEVNLHWVTSGEEAIDYLKNKSFVDIVLMDVRLPGMNGYETTRHIKKMNKKIGVIAQTAHANPEDREQAMVAGCDDYLSKPINQTLLLDKIAMYITRNLS
jgi:PAS domain S-box-containing protein